MFWVWTSDVESQSVFSNKCCRSTRLSIHQLHIRHHDQKKYYISNLNKMYHFAASILFYNIAQLRFPPKATWVQQVVSTVFPCAWLRKSEIRQCFFAFRQLSRRFFWPAVSVCMCMENALLTFSLIHGFRAQFLTSFAQHPPASLCAPRPIFSSEELFTSVSETWVHHGAIRCNYLISLRTKMNRGDS